VSARGEFFCPKTDLALLLRYHAKNRVNPCVYAVFYLYCKRAEMKITVFCLTY